MRADDPATLDALVGDTSPQTDQVIRNLFDTLVEFDPKTEGLRPALAKSWKVENDGRAYIFTLRDAKFADGTPVRASDVKFSLDRARKPENFQSGFISFVKDVEVLDEHTVRVSLKASNPAALEFLSHAAFIVPADYYREVGPKQFAMKPIGSGPFMVTRWVRGQRIELERNPNYWRDGLPYLDSVVISYVPDSNTRDLQVRSGEADANVDVAPSQVASLRKDDSLKVEVTPLYDVNRVWINHNNPTLADRNVRLALLHATPREAIAKVAYAGLAEPANSMLPKIKYWDESVPVPSYDIALAARYLSRSASPDGFRLTLTFVGADNTSRQIASILQDAWKQIGVDLRLRSVDGGTLIANFGKADFETLIAQGNAGVSNIPADDLLATGIFGFVGEVLGYNNKQATSLVQKATTTTDENRRRQAFFDLQKVALEDPAAIPMVFTESAVAMSNDVNGLRILQTNVWRLQEVWKSAGDS